MPVLRPLHGDLLLLLLVGDDGDGQQAGRAHGLRVRERLEDAPVHAADEDDDRVVHGPGAVVGVGLQPSLHRLVVRVDRLEQQDDERDHHDRHPGAAAELRDRDDEQDHERRRRDPTPLSHALNFQPRLALLLVVAHHPGLAQRERREHPDRVERDQRVGQPAERDDQQPPRPGEDEHAVGEDEPVTPVRELAGQVPVAGR